jgi:predicted RNA-binding protein YlqC (UPF0109 family)
MDELINLVRTMVCAIVDDEESIEIDYDEQTSFVSIHVKVADEETGKIIGRHGSMAEAFRTVLRGASNKWDSTKRIALEIIEPEEVLKAKHSSRPKGWNSQRQNHV